MIFLKVLLLLVYLVLLIAVYRVVDYIAWPEGAGVATLVDPFALSLKQLRWLLHARGINYHNAIEKKDLSDLVNATGAVTNEEVKVAEDINTDTSYDAVTFTDKNDFAESIDKTDDVWLVQIVADSKAVIVDSEWKKLRKRAHAAGLHTGKVICKNTLICETHSFFTSQLLLSYHYQKEKKGIHQKHYFTRRADANLAFHWLSGALQGTVEEIPNQLSFKQDWLSHRALKSHPVQLVYVSPFRQVPINFATLKVKFKENVRFGKLTWKESASDFHHVVFGEHSLLLPQSFIYVLTDKGVYMYGDGTVKGNLIHFNHLHLFLRFLRFDVNLLFTWSIYVCNLLVTLTFFATQSNIFTRIVAVVKSFVAYNAILLGGWLFLSSYNMHSFGTFTSNIHILATNHTASTFHTDILKLSKTPYLLGLGFVLFFYLALCLLRKLRILSNDPDTESALSDILFLNDNQTFANNDISQRWIERLATPGLWLQPLIPSDYIEDLPVWQYSGQCVLSSDESEGENRAQSPTRTASPSPTRPWESSVNEPSRGRSCFIETTRQSSLYLKRGILRSLRSCLRGRSPRVRQTSGPPSGMREDTSCSICLENYTACSKVCGLPCRHVFHHQCILSWLHSDRHCCPICRWPAYQSNNR